MNGRAEELIKNVLATRTIKDVFLTACGGSLVDLYPGYYFVNAESETMHAHWLTAKESYLQWLVSHFEGRTLPQIHSCHRSPETYLQAPPHRFLIPVPGSSSQGS